MQYEFESTWGQVNLFHFNVSSIFCITVTKTVVAQYKFFFKVAPPAQPWSWLFRLAPQPVFPLHPYLYFSVRDWQRRIGTGMFWCVVFAQREHAFPDPCVKHPRCSELLKKGTLILFKPAKEPCCHTLVRRSTSPPLHQLLSDCFKEKLFYIFYLSWKETQLL